MWIGFTVLENLIGDFHPLDCFNCGLWTWTQHIFFPCLFLSTSSIYFIIPFILIPFYSLSCLNFPTPLPPPVFINLSFTRPSSLSCQLSPSFALLSFFFSLRAKDMKNRLAFLRRRNESPGSNPASKLDKSMKSVK